MNSSDDVTIRPLDIEADVEKLVEMWRASDDQWPGTFTRGVTLTADCIRAWHRREEMLDVRVAEVDDRHIPWPASPEVGHWGAATNPESDRSLILVSPYPHVRLFDWGDAGGHLGWQDAYPIPARGQVERLGYLVLADDSETARGYCCLRGNYSG